ncbi:MAG: hypothetical protein MHM6MM_003683 [Cercozoa sp. M6MM]
MMSQQVQPRVVIRSAHGRFVSGMSSMQDAMQATPAHHLVIEPKGALQFGLRSQATGRYLSYVNGVLQFIGGSVGPNELFTISPTEPNKVAFMHAGTGAFVTADQTGQLVCRSKWLREWEEFEICGVNNEYDLVDIANALEPDVCGPLHFSLCGDRGAPRNLRMQGHNGMWLCTEANGMMVVNRPVPQAWETFKLQCFGNNKFALLNAHGRYCCAEQTGNFVGNRTQAQQWELFRLIFAPGGRVGLQSVAHRKFVCAESNGMATCNRDNLDGWEKFSVQVTFQNPQQQQHYMMQMNQDMQMRMQRHQMRMSSQQMANMTNTMMNNAMNMTNNMMTMASSMGAQPMHGQPMPGMPTTSMGVQPMPGQPMPGMQQQQMPQPMPTHQSMPVQQPMPTHQPMPVQQPVPVQSTNPYGSATVSATAVPQQQRGGYADCTTQFAPTVAPAANFDADRDAQALRQAMKGFGTNERAIIDIIGARSNAQRQQIKAAFSRLFNRDLVKDIKKETSGNFENLLVALLYTPVEFDAVSLRKAMKGIGTKHKTVCEVLLTKTNAQIELLKQAFSRLFQRDLVNDLASEFRSRMETLVCNIARGSRVPESTPVDVNACKADARRLKAAGLDKFGTDEETFIRILSERSFKQLREITKEYNKIADYSLVKSIKKEFRGDLEDALVYIVQYAQAPHELFAERLFEAIDRLGTSDSKLIRVVVARSEIDLHLVDQRVGELSKGRTLRKVIKSETSGDYKRLLLKIFAGEEA